MKTRLLSRLPPIGAGICVGIGAFVLIYFVGDSRMFQIDYSSAAAAGETTATSTPLKPLPTLDKAAYDYKMLKIANYGTTTSISASSTASTTPIVHPWPVKTAPYPNAEAILPFNRIVAYYGNFYSTGMGVLGEYPPEEVLQRLRAAAAQWQAADPSTPVIPAIDYIAVTAQASAGADGKYRARMPDSQIQKALDMAAEVHGLVVLDVQVGLSNVQTEIPLLEQFLKLPNVELAIDPEFSMKNGGRPGTVIGTFDATDINYTANYLASLVKQYNLPPKILVVHRFTEDMVTHYKRITPLPEVEIVMDMDGWGFPAKKINTYNAVIAPEPVQFTGFKLFYRADLRAPSTRMLTPAEVLKLKPQPVFIQYQ